MTPYLTILGALALSFGYAVGWGAFVLPGKLFLKSAGPLGTVIGMSLGALAMGVFAWCYHIMVREETGSGGSFAFARRVFGHDHAFLVAWALCLTYIAILWANATALKLVVRYTLGDLLQFGFHYQVAGFDVYGGEVLLSVSAIAICTLLCYFRRRLTANTQIALALVFFLGVLAVAAAALIYRVRAGGAAAPVGPAFSPLVEREGVSQIFRILAMAPWAFVGFEAIVNSSGEFAFHRKKAFAIMAVSLAVSVFVYIALGMLPALALPAGWASWPDYIGEIDKLEGIASMPVFAAAHRALGAPGIGIVVVTMVAALFTGIIASIVALSRQMHAMAQDEILPEWFGALTRDRTPGNAILFIGVLSAAIPFFGRSVIDWPIDVSSIGAAVAYGYTAAAAARLAGERGWKATRAVGALGVVLSVVFSLLLLVPNYLSGSVFAAESYLLLAVWCVAGFLFYRHLFRKDRQQRYGSSTIAWVGLIMMIFFSSAMWIRQTTYNITGEVYGNVVTSAGGLKVLRLEMDRLNDSTHGHTIIEIALLVVSLLIMFSLFRILRRREQLIAIEKAKAEDLNKSKSYFFSTISHDIRTPLNAIIGFSEILRSGMNSEADRNQALDSILVSSKTLLKLINDVLDLSRLEAGSMTIAMVPTPFQPLLGELVQSFRASNPKKDVEIRSICDDMPPLVIDPARIRQILFNLVGNAIKFTDSGHVEVRAMFTRNDDPDTGTLEVIVEDTGCGIAEEDIANIHSPYVQVRNKNSRNGGTGLGLAISRQLCEVMGGYLSISSKLGKGSVFTMTLPSVIIAESGDDADDAATIDGNTWHEQSTANPPQPEQTPPLPPQAAGEAAPPAPEPEAAAKPARSRILIVDDQKMNLLVLKAMLDRLGKYEVVMAENGRIALDILTAEGAEAFDMVLTDMWMPVMDGAELVAAIRSLHEYKTMPVYVITADVEASRTYTDVGFDGIILKPVTLEKLKRRLNN